MKLGIYGAGGAGREVKEIAESLNLWDEIVFIDDFQEVGVFKNIPIMPFSEFEKGYSNTDTEVVIALGEPEHKTTLYKKIKETGYAYANVIHPNAMISPEAKLGKGIIVKAGVIVSVDAVIGDNVSIEEYAVIGHDCVIGAHSQISSFVMIAGHCEVGEGTYIAIHVAVRDRIKIGANSVVGMGSMVSRDIPNNVIALGNPARPMKKKDDQKVF